MAAPSPDKSDRILALSATSSPRTSWFSSSAAALCLAFSSSALSLACILRIKATSSAGGLASRGSSSAAVAVAAEAGCPESSIAWRKLAAVLDAASLTDARLNEGGENMEGDGGDAGAVRELRWMNVAARALSQTMAPRVALEGGRSRRVSLHRYVRATEYAVRAACKQPHSTMQCVPGKHTTTQPQCGYLTTPKAIF